MPNMIASLQAEGSTEPDSSVENSRYLRRAKLRGRQRRAVLMLNRLFDPATAQDLAGVAAEKAFRSSVRVVIEIRAQQPVRVVGVSSIA